MQQFIKYIDSPVGQLTLASDGENLTGLWIRDQKYYGSQFHEFIEKDLPVFHQVEKWLKDYFQKKNPVIDFPLKSIGTPFRQRVWQQLLKIPYGEVITYDALANIIANQTGKKKCAQAIGQAVGHNPISIIIPCHRVVGKNGSLTGYAGGIDKKITLLEIEDIDLTNFYVPKK